MGKDEIYMSVPSFFKCPISLDVMKSPVSLCTGVTYDRTSIQRWLDGGNNTCPATMQVLETKEFVPNHTLERLIRIWSSNNDYDYDSASVAKGGLDPQYHSGFISDLMKQLLESETEKKDDDIMLEGVGKILCFGSESAENRRFVGSNGLFVDYLIRSVVSSDMSPELQEAVLKLLHLVNGAAGKEKTGLVSALGRVLRTGRPGSRVAAAGIVETFAKDVETKRSVFEHQELGVELLGILKQGRYQQEVEKQAVLSCLISLSSPRRNKQKLVRAGGVKTVGDMITVTSHTLTVELLFTLLEMLAGCTEGRLAIIDDPNCIPTIINKLIKVSTAVNEHGVALLWGLCYLFRDQRVKDSVIKSNGGLTKILLLMQSDCSPAVKRMCCDLLRIFRVNSKSCLSTYDTKTTHIMPC